MFLSTLCRDDDLPRLLAIILPLICKSSGKRHASGVEYQPMLKGRRQVGGCIARNLPETPPQYSAARNPELLLSQTFVGLVVGVMVLVWVLVGVSCGPTIGGWGEPPVKIWGTHKTANQTAKT